MIYLKCEYRYVSFRIGAQDVNWTIVRGDITEWLLNQQSSGLYEGIHIISSRKISPDQASELGSVVNEENEPITVTNGFVGNSPKLNALRERFALNLVISDRCHIAARAAQRKRDVKWEKKQRIYKIEKEKEQRARKLERTRRKKDRIKRELEAHVKVAVEKRHKILKDQVEKSLRERASKLMAEERPELESHIADRLYEFETSERKRKLKELTTPKKKTAKKKRK